MWFYFVYLLIVGLLVMFLLGKIVYTLISHRPSKRDVFTSIMQNSDVLHIISDTEQEIREAEKVVQSVSEEIKKWLVSAPIVKTGKLDRDRDRYQDYIRDIDYTFDVQKGSPKFEIKFLSEDYVEVLCSTSIPPDVRNDYVNALCRAFRNLREAFVVEERFKELRYQIRQAAI